MSTMSPKSPGDALLEGFRFGIGIRQARQQMGASLADQQMRQATAFQKIEQAYNADLDDLVERYRKALPGDQPVRDRMYDAIATKYPDRFNLSKGSLEAMVREGFGVESEPEKFFTGQERITLEGMSNAVSKYVMSVPMNELTDPAQMLYHADQVKRQAQEAGLGVEYQDTFVNQLIARADLAVKSATNQSTLWQNRQSIHKSIMDVIEDRLAMAYKAQSTGFINLGGVKSGFDPKYQDEYNQITFDADQMINDALDLNILVTPSQIMMQLANRYRGVPSMQKALSHVVSDPANPTPPTMYQPQTQNLGPVGQGAAPRSLPQDASDPASYLKSFLAAGSSGDFNYSTSTDRDGGIIHRLVNPATGEEIELDETMWERVQAEGLITFSGEAQETRPRRRPGMTIMTEMKKEWQ